jgi:thiol:disulfide interchange protein DsbD
MLRSLILICCLLVSNAFADTAASGRTLFVDEQEQAVLEPDQAFGLKIEPVDNQTLNAHFTVAPGHYLYRERISFKIKDDGTSNVIAVEMPPGEAKQDPNFGEMLVFHQGFDAKILLKHAGSAPQTLTLLASYQGCSDKGLCYAPIRKTIEVDLLATGNTASSNDSGSETDRIRTLLQGGKLWLIVLGFFGFGLLLSLTPCVFPMIPILSGIIVGQGQHPTRMHAFNLSVAYTLGMAVSYTLAGIVAAFSGHLISTALQNPWALGFGALVFVALALSMFGFYELQLPSSLENRLINTTNRIKGGRFISVFVMGALSALIMSPCVAAPLAGALLYIGQTHDVILGGAALFAMSLGMGVPLLLLGASAGALLPRSGPWMNAVRNFFGVVMLGMAVWLIGPVIPASLQLALWSALLIVPAVYLHALDGLPPHSNKWAKMWKGIGIMLLVAGIALLLGALAGSRNPLQPLEGLRATTGSAAHAPVLPFQRVKNVAELDRAVQQAQGKYVMLDFYADWCVACKEFEQYTFADPRVRKLLENAILLQADVTQNGSDDAALLSRFGLYGPPGIIFFDPNGNEISAASVVGYQDADKFLVTLNTVYGSKEGACAPSLAC